MLKEAAKVLQSGRQIAIPPNLFAAVRERRSCNPIRRLRVQQQSLARTPGQTRLDFNLSGRARAGDPTTTCTDSTHVCVPHPQTECVIGGAGARRCWPTFFATSRPRRCGSLRAGWRSLCPAKRSFFAVAPPAHRPEPQEVDCRYFNSHSPHHHHWLAEI